VRGFFAGGFWGLVVGGVAVAGASLVNPPPKQPQPVVADEATPENTREINSDPDIKPGDGPAIEMPSDTAQAPETPGAETPVEAEALPEPIEEPASESRPAVDTAEAPAPAADAVTDDTADAEEVAAAEVDADSDTVPPTNVPASVGTEDDTVAPEISDESVSAPAEPAETQAPVTVTAVEEAPETPASPEPVLAETVEPDRLAATETAPANAPVVADTATLETPETLADSGADNATAEAPVEPAAQPAAPEVPEADQDVAQVNTPIQEPAVAAEAPEAEDAPDDTSEAPTVEAATDTVPLTPQAPLSPATPEAGESAPGTSDSVQTAQADAPPVVSVLPGGSTGVRVNRLTDNDEEEQPPQQSNDTDETAPATPELPDDAPAVQRYAAVAENPDELPELSVVLADDGSFDGGIAAVAGLPFPVSVMLSPSIPNVENRMAAYRAAGVEVGMLVNLPPAATASDVAIYFEAAMSSVPEAFAVLDATGDTQSDADVIRQTISVLSEDGHGLITVPRGLNTAPRVAAEAGVAAGVIFRDLDGDGQDARTIQRFMDQAAFRAGQTPGIMLLGRVRPDTISALTRWGAQSSRAEQVAVVPSSAILTSEN